MRRPPPILEVLGERARALLRSAAPDGRVLAPDATAALDLLRAGLPPDALAVLETAPPAWWEPGADDLEVALRDEEGVLRGVARRDGLLAVDPGTGGGPTPEEVARRVAGAAVLVVDGPVTAPLVRRAAQEAAGAPLVVLLGRDGRDPDTDAAVARAVRVVVDETAPGAAVLALRVPGRPRGPSPDPPPHRRPERPGPAMLVALAQALDAAEVLTPAGPPPAGGRALDVAGTDVSGTDISGTDVLAALRAGRGVEGLPPAAAAALAVVAPPPARSGFVVLLTGLSGSGKSTVAAALVDLLRAEGSRRVTVLDGDHVRHHLSRGLGFSREDRDANVERIGYVAAVAASHGGAAVCAPIAPYASTRARVRALVEPVGELVLVHVSTALEVCEARDPKGLYVRARRGEIPAFTGISDPYEEPEDADVVVDTAVLTGDEAARRVLDRLRSTGLVR